MLKDKRELDLLLNIDLTPYPSPEMGGECHAAQSSR